VAFYVASEGGELNVSPLIIALRDPAPEVRLNAVIFLGKIRKFKYY